MNAKQTKLQTLKRELKAINEYLQTARPTTAFFKKFVNAAKERKAQIELDILFIENPAQYYNHKQALENFIFHN